VSVSESEKAHTSKEEIDEEKQVGLSIIFKAMRWTRESWASSEGEIVCQAVCEHSYQVN
jgi:hypothetical protein